MVILETALDCMKKIFMFVAGLSIIFVFISGCIQEYALSEGYGHEPGNYNIYNYSTPGFEINQTQAFTVWERVKNSDDAKFVTREKNYSVTVFVQSYAQGISATKWIVVASSIPEKAEDIKAIVFRLDHQTFGYKRSYYFSYPKGKEFNLQQSISIMEEELRNESGEIKAINEKAVVLLDENYIYSYLESDLADTYLFNWDEIPGKDSDRFIGFLEKQYGVVLPAFGKPANIEKIEDNRAIRVITGENTVLLRLNSNNTGVNLKVVDGKTDDLIVKMENGKLNIYGETNMGATIIFNKYAGRTIFHGTKVAWIAQTRPIKDVSGRIVIPGDEVNGTKVLPRIEASVVPASPPAYRGTSTIAGLVFTAPDYVENGTEILVDYRTEMLHTDGSIEPGPEGFSLIPEKKQLILERMYLFSWDEIPGKDSGKLIEYLERLYFLLDWLKTAKIEKIDNGRTIRVFNEENSILLKLNDEKTSIDLRTDVYAPHELFARMDNNKLRIYDRQTPFENGNGRLVAISNLTVKTGNASVEGDYFIKATARFNGWIIGENVFSFKIGKGGKKSGGKSMTEGSQNIGYSADNPPPLNEAEKAETGEVALRDPYLNGRMNKITGVTSEFLDLENYSGFFAVVTVDAGNPDYPGEIIRYIVDREEKKIIGSNSTPRKALEYFRGEVFDEVKSNSTKKWDARNFPGLWLDHETNASTETLIIDQNILDNSNRVLEKHNLIYTTYEVPYKFQVFANINVTEVSISKLPFEGRNIFDYASIPAEEKNETYQAIGWQGEKHAVMDGNRIAKMLLEQNASEVRTLTVSESWNMGEGYVLTANSIDAKAAARQAWFTLAKNGTKLCDIVLAPRRLWIYTPENDTLPLFITYFNKISAGSYTDEADLKYTWLRSKDTTEIKPGRIFGVMEVTSADNGKIEFRNRVPLELAHDSTINLMGNLNIKVGSSNTSLSFHPYIVKDPNDI